MIDFAEIKNSIPDEFHFTKVKYLVDNSKYYQIGDGDHGAISPSDYVDDGIPYIRVQNLSYTGELQKKGLVFISEEKHNENLKSKIIPSDVLIAKTGTVGKLLLVNNDYEEWNTTSSVGKITLDQSRYQPKYILYYFQSKHIQDLIIQISFQKSAQPGFNIDDLVDFPVISPILSKQKLISKYLDKKTRQIDVLIENVQKKIELLKDQRTSLINRCATKGLNPDVEMKDSGVEWIGDIPKHWELVPLKRILAEGKESMRTGPFGSELKSSDFVDQGVKVYNQRTVYDDDYASGEIFVTEEKRQKLEGFTVRPGDLLITTRGTIGKVSEVPENAELGIIHPCLIRFRINRDYIQKSFLMWYINETSHFLTNVLYESDSTTIEVIYSDTLRNVGIPKPPLEEQQSIVEFLSDQVLLLDGMLSNENKRVTLLKEYRQSLISSAVTGKAQVTEEMI